MADTNHRVSLLAAPVDSVAIIASSDSTVPAGPDRSSSASRFAARRRSVAASIPHHPFGVRVASVASEGDTKVVRSKKSSTTTATPVGVSRRSNSYPPSVVAFATHPRSFDATSIRRQVSDPVTVDIAERTWVGWLRIWSDRSTAGRRVPWSSTSSEPCSAAAACSMWIWAPSTTPLGRSPARVIAAAI
ncbi:MAG: hypothetical protein R2823_05350 [Acidimicrobiia bacterium]